MLIAYTLLRGVVYLAWCDFAMVATKKQHEILFKSRKMSDGDPDNN
jgi:hypothetical protein